MMAIDDDAEASDEEAAAEDLSPREKRLFLLGIGGVVVVLLCFANMVVWLNGGGLLSFYRAWSAIGAGAISFDVDDLPFRFLFGIPLCLAMLGIYALAGIDPSRRGAFFGLGVVAIAGGMGLDFVCDEAIVTHVAAAHGYRYCASGDREVGTGRGKVSFHHYVATGATCPTKRALDTTY